jgi:hypothetical protein
MSGLRPIAVMARMAMVRLPASRPLAVRLQTNELASGLRWIERQFSSIHWYTTQTPAFHRAHLRTSRRVWRMVVLATHKPLTRVLLPPSLRTKGDHRS